MERTNSLSRNHFPRKKGAVVQEQQHGEDGACSSDESSSSDNSPRRSPKNPSFDSGLDVSKDLVGPSYSTGQDVGTSRIDLPSDKGIASQEHQLVKDGACESSPSHDSQRTSPIADIGCSSDECSSSDNSPRSSPKKSKSDLVLDVGKVVGGPSTSQGQDVGSSASFIGNNDKRHFDPHEMTETHNRDREGGSSSHFAVFPRDEWVRDSSSGRPRVVPIEVYVIAPKAVVKIEIRLNQVLFVVGGESIEIMWIKN